MTVEATLRYLGDLRPGKVDWLLGLAGFGLLFVSLSWFPLARRDIRVSGEGSWRLSRLNVAAVGLGRRRRDRA